MTFANPHSNTPLQVHELTDLGNAEQLVAMHGDSVRYNLDTRAWHIWDGNRWSEDIGDALIREKAKETAQALMAAVPSIKDSRAQDEAFRHARYSQRRVGIEAMIHLAKSDPRIRVRAEDFDRDPDLLSVANGVLDLRTFELLAAKPEYMLSVGTDVAYKPEAEAPRFERHVREVMAGDEEMAAFLQRAAGYSLTGHTYERRFFVLYGRGRNGKGKLTGALRAAMGDAPLAESPAFETFAKGGRTTRGGTRSDVAQLRRARFVEVPEFEENKHLDDGLIKRVTGGDPVTVRDLHERSTSFMPQWKIWIHTNFMPRMDGSDAAMWDRVLIVPFGVQFDPTQEQDLSEHFRREGEGILSWMVAGCKAWREKGLAPPQKVLEATQEQQLEEDVFGLFLRDYTRPGDGVGAKALRQAYEDFCAQLGEKPIEARSFGRKIAKTGHPRREKGFEGERYWYPGLRLREEGENGDSGPIKFGSSPRKTEDDHSEAHSAYIGESKSSHGVLGANGAEPEKPAPLQDSPSPSGSALNHSDEVDNPRLVELLSRHGQGEDVARELAEEFNL